MPAVEGTDRQARHAFQDFPDCIRQNQEIEIDDLASPSEARESNGTLVQILRSVHGRA